MRFIGSRGARKGPIADYSLSHCKMYFNRNDNRFSDEIAIKCVIISSKLGNLLRRETEAFKLVIIQDLSNIFPDAFLMSRSTDFPCSIPLPLLGDGISHC